MQDRSGPLEIAALLGGDIDDAFEHLRVPAWIVDRDGVVRWENARSIELFGDIRGRRFGEAMAPETHPRVRLEFTKKILNTSRTSDYSAVFLSPSGERIPLEVHAVAIEDGERAVGIFGIAAVDETRPAPAPLRGQLTPRQYEVLRALGRGCSTDQMAGALILSRETVRNHIRGLFRALQVHSRLEAVAEGRRRGLID
jgi:PAS domain S-box-containing protein